VLDRFEVRLRTLPAPSLQETPWQLKKLNNTHDFRSQSKLVRESLTRSLVAAQTDFSQLWELWRDWTQRANVQKYAEAYSESDASTTYVSSLFNSDEIEES
jgi:hypothetical protein